MQFDALLETEPQLRYAKSSTPLEAEPLLRVQDVAAILKVPVSWVYERTRQRGIDQIPHLKVGKYVRFRLSEVEEYLERLRRG
jgi:excisionase family DNA binding protein